MARNLFDTHAHFEGTAEETSAILARAYAAGVSHILAVGGSEDLNRGVEMAVAAAARAPGDSPRILKAIGWDRDQINRDLPELDFDGCAALGEIGLDYFYSSETRKEQRELFGRQLERARALDLPVIIHTREADDDTLGLLREIPSRGVIHCFTGNPQFCRQLLDLGFYISISGIVTFRAADNVRESALVVPNDRILIETDAPFLAPVPKRGTANESAFIVHTAKFLADLRQIPEDVFAELTTANAHALFTHVASR